MENKNMEHSTTTHSFDDLGQPLVTLRYEKLAYKQAKRLSRMSTSRMLALWFVTGAIPALIYGGAYALGYQLTAKECHAWGCHTVLLPEFYICVLIHMAYFYVLVKWGRRGKG